LKHCTLAFIVKAGDLARLASSHETKCSDREQACGPSALTQVAMRQCDQHTAPVWRNVLSVFCNQPAHRDRLLPLSAAEVGVIGGVRGQNFAEI